MLIVDKRDFFFSNSFFIIIVIIIDDFLCAKKWVVWRQIWCRNAHNLFIKSSSCLLSNKKCFVIHNFFCVFFCILAGKSWTFFFFHLWGGKRGSVFYVFFVRKFMNFFFSFIYEGEKEEAFFMCFLWGNLWIFFLAKELHNYIRTPLVFSSFKAEKIHPFGSKIHPIIFQNNNIFFWNNTNLITIFFLSNWKKWRRERKSQRLKEIEKHKT